MRNCWPPGNSISIEPALAVRATCVPRVRWAAPSASRPSQEARRVGWTGSLRSTHPAGKGVASRTADWRLRGADVPPRRRGHRDATSPPPWRASRRSCTYAAAPFDDPTCPWSRLNQCIHWHLSGHVLRAHLTDEHASSSGLLRLAMRPGSGAYTSSSSLLLLHLYFSASCALTIRLLRSLGAATQCGLL